MSSISPTRPTPPRWPPRSTNSAPIVTALPLIIGRQHMLLLDALGGRLDATRWPYADPDVKQQAISPGILAWAACAGISASATTATPCLAIAPTPAADWAGSVTTTATATCSG